MLVLVEGDAKASSHVPILDGAAVLGSVVVTTVGAFAGLAVASSSQTTAFCLYRSVMKLPTLLRQDAADVARTVPVSQPIDHG
jgi:hypothetical protein